MEEDEIIAVVLYLIQVNAVSNNALSLEGSQLQPEGCQAPVNFVIIRRRHLKKYQKDIGCIS